MGILTSRMRKMTPQKAKAIERRRIDRRREAAIARFKKKYGRAPKNYIEFLNGKPDNVW